MGIPTQVGLGGAGYSTGSTAVAWASEQADDIGILVVESDTADIDLVAPSGWAHVAGSPFNTSTPGTYVPKLNILWQRATSGSMANASIPDLGDHTASRITVFRGCKLTGNPILAVSALYTNGASNTSSFPSVTVAQDDALVLLIGGSGDSSGDPTWDTITNAALADITKIYDTSFSTGNDGAVTVQTATLVAGTGPTGISANTHTSSLYDRSGVTLVLAGQFTIQTALETDSANTAFSPTNPVVTANEVDSAPVATATKSVTAGVASETDSATATTWRKYLLPVIDTSSTTSVGPARIVPMAETLNLIQAAPLSVMGKVLAEQLALTHTATAAGIYPRSLAETMLASEAATLGWPAALADTLNLSDALSGVTGVTVAEALGLSPALLPSLKFGLTLADTYTCEDAALRYLSGVATETLNLSGTMTDSWLFPRTLSDTLEITPALSGSLIFRVTSEEELSLTDAELIAMIFSGSLSDTLEVALGAVSPTGDFSAWAVNTTTAAVSEYTNFEFNSFADIYPHYVAAASTGLYTLVGDTDAGTNVIGKIRSGYAQFGGANLATLDMAYLGVRGAGDYVFRVVTADGQSYDYAVTAVDMKTARIQLGRGLRARYIAIELESSGQDFDLESVEILPLALSRRV